ncbi:hypothetical protein CMV_012144 [Castanea mollissima]|uniref:Uncharacterized protein n=1 Tax=Castanea mollissima TaxID=60419 RepID=A0A8J4R406_9ROSI|nr:hypothetical protein CMV_012144 [Castanea mollissima]
MANTSVIHDTAASQPIDKPIPAGVPGHLTNNYFWADGKNCGNFITWNILHLPSAVAKALAVAGVGRVTARFGGDPTEAEAQPSIIVCVDGDEGRVRNVLILLPLAFYLSS